MISNLTAHTRSEVPWEGALETEGKMQRQRRTHESLLGLMYKKSTSAGWVRLGTAHLVWEGTADTA